VLWGETGAILLCSLFCFFDAPFNGVCIGSGVSFSGEVTSVSTAPLDDSLAVTDVPRDEESEIISSTPSFCRLAGVFGGVARASCVRLRLVCSTDGDLTDDESRASKDPLELAFVIRGRISGLADGVREEPEILSSLRRRRSE
jgi:hypothetical protein